jgi:hypothetical protein
MTAQPHSASEDCPGSGWRSRSDSYSSSDSGRDIELRFARTRLLSFPALTASQVHNELVAAQTSTSANSYIVRTI